MFKISEKGNVNKITADSCVVATDWIVDGVVLQAKVLKSLAVCIIMTPVYKM